MEPATTAVQYAGFWKRFLAYIIDAILLSVVYFIVLVPVIGLMGIGAATYGEDPEATAGFMMAAMGAYFFSILVIMIAGWLYFALMESSAKGASLGKMALGIKVTDLNGSRISFGKASGRYFGKMISGVVLYIGFIMAAFTEKKQALHDIMAGCLVVNK